jgi:hypothetical protein
MTKSPGRSVTPRHLLVLALLLPLFGGCGTAGGFLARGLFGDQVSPMYEPEDRLTLVLVSQGNEQNAMPLGDPSLPDSIASTIAYYLQQEKVITHLIDQTAVAAVRKELGDRFGTTPPTAVARKVHADQVIYVEVNEVIFATEPGMYKPTAVVYVWVVDANKNEVLFPVSGTGRDDLTPGRPGPFVLPCSLHEKASDSTNPTNPTLIAELRRKLAERIGRDVARLFFTYDKAKRGEDFQD